MPRPLRIIVPDVPYHITQKGNREQNVFFTHEDRKRYLKWLSSYSELYEFDIIAYCLMSNHVHMVGIPRKSNSIARTIQILHTRHTQTINREKDWKGHLWHSRYFSTPLDDKHLWAAIRYVEQNPLRAGIIARAEDYLWSSARAHCGLAVDNVISKNVKLETIFDDWVKQLKELPDKEVIDRIRDCTYRGTPCGDIRFRSRISRKFGQRINSDKRGRPFGSTKNKGV